MNCTGFNYIAAPSSKILILGSIPGVKSLDEQQYYAHPRNAFWNIMETLFSIPTTATYENRITSLCNKKIALWDVLKKCHRNGSLDTSIKNTTNVINNFPDFFEAHKNIKHIFFNGQKAQQLFTRHYKKNPSTIINQLSTTLLPSTSPAHASLNLQQKMQAWSVILDHLT